MRSEEFSAKTIEEALAKALVAFEAEKDEVTYEVLEEATKGFLGFGSKNARILVTEVFNHEKI